MDKQIRELTEKFFIDHPTVRVHKGAIILRADQNPTGVYYLRSGLVKQYVIGGSGDTFVIHVYRPGSFFPMAWAINKTPNAYYFEAINDVFLTVAPLADTYEFLKTNPTVLFHFVSRLLLGLSGVIERMEYLVLETAYQKIVRLLVYFAKTFGKPITGDKILIPIALSHREIATWIGTTRETTSLQIEALKKRGIITNRGRLLVVNSLERLENESG